MGPFIHKTSDVQSLKIGVNTNIWQFCIVLPGAAIGNNCNICSHCFIENDVIIGDNVTIKNGVSIYDGVVLESSVFIGPNVTFTNDKMPRSKMLRQHSPKTIIKYGASIGGGAVILPGITIGENAIIGAGAIVTKNVDANVVLYGEGSKVRGYTKI